MPETADADFNWDAFVRTNDSELVATWGNLAHRVLTFVHRQFSARVPDPGTPRPADQALLARVNETLTRTGKLISAADSGQRYANRWRLRGRPTAT